MTRHTIEIAAQEILTDEETYALMLHLPEGIPLGKHTLSRVLVDHVRLDAPSAEAVACDIQSAHERLKHNVKAGAAYTREPTVPDPLWNERAIASQALLNALHETGVTGAAALGMVGRHGLAWRDYLQTMRLRKRRETCGTDKQQREAKAHHRANPLPWEHAHWNGCHDMLVAAGVSEKIVERVEDAVRACEERQHGEDATPTAATTEG